MGYWDPDYYFEDCKSEADEIIEEAKDKIIDLIYEKAKEEINCINEAKKLAEKNYSDAKLKIGELTQQNIIKDKEIEKLKTQIESGDKKSLTNLPIAIGDKVWVVVYDHDDEITCPVCGGTRSIERLIEGVKYKADCPKCSYSVPKDSRMSDKCCYNFYKVKECKVTELVVNLTKNSRTISYWAVDAGWNGSTRKYDEDKVFKFKEDAEDCAEKLHRISRAKAYEAVGREVPDILKPYLEVKEHDSSETCLPYAGV